MSGFRVWQENTEQQLCQLFHICDVSFHCLGTFQSVGIFSGVLYSCRQRKVYCRGYCPILQWIILELQRLL